MRIINLTPHTIKLQTEDGTTEFEPSGKVGRLNTYTTEPELENGIPFVSIEYGEPKGIPNQLENTLFLVSRPVFENVDRQDLIAPDTSPDSAIRDTNGNITAVKQFLRK